MNAVVDKAKGTIATADAFREWFPNNRVAMGIATIGIWTLVIYLAPEAIK